MNARTILVAILIASFLCCLSLAEWTQPVPVTEVNTEYTDWTPFLSFDGLSLYFARYGTDTFYYSRIFEATRQEPYGPFTSVSEVLSSSGHVHSPWISPDNLRMYYYAQTVSPDLRQIKISERASVNDPWPQGTSISELNVLGKLSSPRLTADELIIFFGSNDIPGGEGGFDMWMASRPDMNSPFGAVSNLSEINTASNEVCPSVSPDGFILLFQSDRNGSYQLFKATRASLSESFGNVEHLSIFDIPGYTNQHPCLSSDGRVLYFTRLLGDNMATADIYVSYIIGANKASNPRPAHGAKYVDPNVVLRWAPGIGALSHDVYLGTSYDDVNDANTFSDEYMGNYDVNSFDPCGLNPGTTYYWRIDETVDSNIYKGDVWSFTTLGELYSYLVSWWMFDEGEGTIAYDSAGTNHGFIYGADWTLGQIDSALSFDGMNDYVDMADTVKDYLETSYTASAWIKANTISLNKAILSYRHSTDSNPVLFALGQYYTDVHFAVRDNSHNLVKAIYANALTTNTWCHIAGVREGNTVYIYVNSVNGNPGSGVIGAISPDNLKIGATQWGGNPVSDHFDGTIDDVMIFNKALSEEEILEIYLMGIGNKAFAPSPADGAIFVDPNVVLSWAPGKDALSHDVYLGTNYDDVNDANTLSDEYKGNFDVNSYDPCGLNPGATYYWRVDESTDSNTHKGDVWSFTTRVKLESHIVGWWKFDKGEGTIAYDATGNNHGSIFGATWTTGQINGALSFDGVDDYVDMADTVKNYLDTSYTVSAWIKVDAISLNKIISAYRNSIYGDPVLFQITQFNEDIGFTVRDDFHNTAHADYMNALTTNTWCHIAGVREGNTVNIYANGVSGTPDSATLGVISPDNLKIGALQFEGNPPSNHFDGTIDDVMIFDRALSEAEIWEVYQSSLCEEGYPCINVWPETLEFYADEGGPNPALQILSVINYGDDVLNYHITGDCSWLNVDPNVGSSAGELNEVSVSVDISGLDCGLYDCNLIVSDPNASNTPLKVPVQLEVFHEYCHIDVRVVPVAVLIDPATTSEVRTTLPDSITGVVRGNTYYIEIWASDIRKINTGLTGVYVDVDFCDETSASAVEHGDIFVTLPDGTIQPGGVDEFGGSALPSGGGIEPEWVRVGWIQMSADFETETCTISLLPSSTGVAPLERGTIPWTLVDLGSVELQITPPVRSYDLDGDDFIGLSDLSYFAGSWKQRVPPADEEHDFDCDGFVGVGDLSWFATGWQKSTDDPTILYPPCPGGGEAAWLLSNSAPRIPNSNTLENSSSIATSESPADIAFAMAVLDSPSSSDTAAILPTSIKRLTAGQTYHLELWVSDIGYINTGLTSAYVDLSFPDDAVTVTDVSNGSIFTMFTDEMSILSDKIDELGGSSLPGGDGIEPEWARVAVVEILADATLPFVTFTLSTSSTGVAALARGTIPWDDISLGSLLICPANFNGDAVVDMKDLAIFASAWKTKPGDLQWDPGCDISIPADNFINEKDLAWLVDSWLEGITP